MALVFRAASGKVAIWDGETDDNPFTAPLSNLGRVKFHSDLDYPRIIDVKTYSLNLPAIPNSGSGQGSDNGIRIGTYTLGSHGITGQPYVIGQITVGSVSVAFTGSVNVHSASSTSYRDGYGRFLALGVDATNVYVHEYSVQEGDADYQNWLPRPAQSFSVAVYITDILL